jgi:hypothetical protein
MFKKCLVGVGRGWPGVGRRLVVVRRLTFVTGTALSLLGVGRLMTSLPWAADALLAAAACIFFAYFSERGDDE